jgi:hypothetical protein
VLPPRPPAAPPASALLVSELAVLCQAAEQRASARGVSLGELVGNSVAERARAAGLVLFFFFFYDWACFEGIESWGYKKKKKKKTCQSNIGRENDPFQNSLTLREKSLYSCCVKTKKKNDCGGLGATAAVPARRLPVRPVARSGAAGARLR